MIVETIIIVAIIVLALFLFLYIMLKGKIISEKFKTFKLKVLLLVGSDEIAKKYALKIVDKFPKNYFAHKTLGQLYEKEGNNSVALDEYIRAVELNEKDYEMHFKVAELLQKTEKSWITSFLPS